MRHHRIAWLLLLILILGFCTGCYADIPQQEEDSTSQEDTQLTETGELPAPWLAEHSFTPDNHLTCGQLGVYPSTNGKGYYHGSPPRYYDIAQSTDMPICGKPGCEHRDESCPSYIPGVTETAEVDGNLYAFCEKDDALELLKVDTKTGDRKVLYRWDTTEKGYYLNSSFYSDGRLYITILSSVAGCDTLLQTVDTATDEVHTLATCNEQSYGSFLGAYGGHAMIDWMTLSEKPLTLEEYLQKHPDQTDDQYFYEYLFDFDQRYGQRELRLYDVQSGDYTDATALLQAGREEIPYTMLGTNGSCHGSQMIYQLGNTVCLYDFATGEARELFDEPHITNAFLVDGRLVYLVHPQNGKLTIHARNLETGEDVLIPNGQDMDVMTFSIHSETAEAFVGLLNIDGSAKNAWIDKDDFYAGNYKNAVVN